MIRHGHTKGGKRSGAFSTWVHLRERCEKESNHLYKYYGAKGISICDRWRLFENFYADMGDRPAGMSLDRINNAGNYEPSNCRWATRKEQMRNMCRNRILSVNGISMTLAEAADRFGISVATIWARLDKYGWDDTLAATTPVFHRKNGKATRRAEGKIA